MKTEKNQSKKILLINGCTEPTGDLPILSFSPYGLLRIQSYLTEHDVDSRIVSIADLTVTENLETLVRDADIIGFSGMTIHAKQMYETATKIKKKFPDKLIVGGSEHFALDYGWILNNKDITGFDACCTMEGELPLLNLARGETLSNTKSMAFIDSQGRMVKQATYPRLNENSVDELLRPSAVANTTQWSSTIFPEFRELFKYTGSTQTGSGCIYACTFCSNEPFMGAGYISNIETSKKEIDSMRENGVNFFFFRDTMLNGNPKHFNSVLDHMIEQNSSHEKMYWFSFISAVKHPQLRQFDKMAKAGCLMVGVGIEDVLGDRRELGKGSNLEITNDFVNEAKESVLVRALMMLGLPNHYELSREEIKERTLNYMKANPQAAYRINLWTPLPGLSTMKEYGDVLKFDYRRDIDNLSQFDTMHNIIDPKKMYEKLGIPQEKRWMKTSQDLVGLRNEIMIDYLNSAEHRNYVESIRTSKSPNAEMRYKIAIDFMNQNLKRYGNN